MVMDLSMVQVCRCNRHPEFSLKILPMQNRPDRARQTQREEEKRIQAIHSSPCAIQFPGSDFPGLEYRERCE